MIDCGVEKNQVTVRFITYDAVFVHVQNGSYIVIPVYREMSGKPNRKL